MTTRARGWSPSGLLPFQSINHRPYGGVTTNTEQHDAVAQKHGRSDLHYLRLPVPGRPTSPRGYLCFSLHLFSQSCSHPRLCFAPPLQFSFGSVSHAPTRIIPCLAWSKLAFDRTRDFVLPSLTQAPHTSDFDSKRLGVQRAQRGHRTQICF
jgi:hypothetical protein